MQRKSLTETILLHYFIH